MRNQSSLIIIVLVLFVIGAVAGQEQSQVRKGPAAQQFINHQHLGWKQLMESNGDCKPPKTSIPVCAFPPSGETERTEWTSPYGGIGGDKQCRRGEIVDPAQGGCRVGAWCSCNEDT